MFFYSYQRFEDGRHKPFSLKIGAPPPVHPLHHGLASPGLGRSLSSAPLRLAPKLPRFQDARKPRPQFQSNLVKIMRNQIKQTTETDK